MQIKWSNVFPPLVASFVLICATDACLAEAAAKSIRPYPSKVALVGPDSVQQVAVDLVDDARAVDAVLLAADDTGMTQPTAELAAAVFPEVPWVGTTQEEWLAGDPHRGFIDTHGAHELLGWHARRGWAAGE